MLKCTVCNSKFPCLHVCAYIKPDEFVYRYFLIDGQPCTNPGPIEMIAENDEAGYVHIPMQSESAFNITAFVNLFPVAKQCPHRTAPLWP